MMTTSYRERLLMQCLRGAGWVKAGTFPASPRVIACLITKGWIELRGRGRETQYRITETGLAAKLPRVQSLA
jgi:hypothetical protein